MAPEQRLGAMHYMGAYVQCDLRAVIGWFWAGEILSGQLGSQCIACKTPHLHRLRESEVNFERRKKARLKCWSNVCCW